MKKRKTKILIRAERIISQFKDDESIYYKELKKSYREYREIKLPDKTTNELYLDHINRLCDLIEQKKNSTVLVAGMFFMILICITLTVISSIKYYDISHNLNKKLDLINNKIDLQISYENLENFNALLLSSSEDYMLLSPLILNIYTESEKTYDIHYDIYLEEDNKDLLKETTIPRNDLLYSIKTKKRDNGIKNLGESTSVNNDLLIYSSEMKTNKEEKVELRMWIDNKNKEDLNKKYRFKLNIKCYKI